MTAAHEHDLTPAPATSGDATSSVLDQPGARAGEGAAAGEPPRALLGCVVAITRGDVNYDRAVRSLLTQTRVPDVIHVVLADTDEATSEIMASYAGRKCRAGADNAQSTEVFVHRVARFETKADAFNYGMTMVEGCDTFLSVDGRASVACDAVAALEAELASSPRVAAVSAACHVEQSDRGLMAWFLTAGQRQSVAMATAYVNANDRSVAALTMHCALFSMNELAQISSPAGGTRVFDGGDAIGVMLTQRIHAAGFDAKLSSSAHVSIPSATNLQDFDTGHVRMFADVIVGYRDGMRSRRRGGITTWGRTMWTLINLEFIAHIVVRVGFLALGVASIIGGYPWVPALVAIPPVVLALVQLQAALAMRDRTVHDVLFAALIVPGELFVLVRIRQYLTAWARARVMERQRKRADNTLADVFPPGAFGLAVTTTLAIAGAVLWRVLDSEKQGEVLGIAWPLVAVVAALQTAIMLRAMMLLRRR